MKFQITTVSNRHRWSKPCCSAIAEPTDTIEDITLYSPSLYYYSQDYPGPSIEVQKAQWQADIKKGVYGNPELIWEFWEEGSYSKHLRGKVSFKTPLNTWWIEIKDTKDLEDLVTEVGQIIIEKDLTIHVYDDYYE